MLENANQWDSLVWLLHEELLDQIFVLLRELLLKSNFLALLIPGNGDLITSEGSITVYQFV